MARLRVERLREEIKREVSDIVRRMKDPRIGFVTITDVELSADLRHVKVYFSVLGPQEDRDQTIQTLQAAAGHVRSELGQRIRLRHVPEVLFRFDPGIERGARVAQLLNQVRRAEAPEGAEG